MTVARAIALVPLGVLLVACDGGGRTTEDPATPVGLEVATEDWTGSSKDQPRPTTRSVEVRIGGDITVEALGEEVTFEVTDIDDGTVSLSSDEPWAPRTESGGINLNSTETDFEVVDGEPLELTTPSTDGGTTVTFTLA